MLGDSADDIIDLEKSFCDSELLFSSKIAKENKSVERVQLFTESLFEENEPESFLTAPLSPPFRKVSNVKFYRPPTPAKPLNKRLKYNGLKGEGGGEEEEEEDIDDKVIEDNEDSPVKRIARMARLNPNLSFIPRLRRVVIE
jgi:hypothetical protein